jgi:hypothetical protein
VGEVCRDRNVRVDSRKLSGRTILECGTLAENILLNIFEVPQWRGLRESKIFFKIFSSLLFLSEQQLPPRTSYDILLAFLQSLFFYLVGVFFRLKNRSGQ